MSERSNTTGRRSAFAGVSALTVAVAATLLFAGPAVRAQDPPPPSQAEARPMGPPPMMAIFTEQVKVGKEASHGKLEERFAQTYSQYAWSRPYIAMTSVSGTPEAWFVSPLGSMEDFEKMIKGWEEAPEAERSSLEQLTERDAENIESARVKLAHYRPELSYGPHVELPSKRYLSVMTFQVRPGHEREFVEAAEIVRSTYEKVGSDENYAVFQVLTGAPNGTYLIFSAMRDLSEFQPDPQKQKAFYDALGDNRSRFTQLVSSSLISSETTLFAFNPAMSNAPPQFAAADPFWRTDRETVATTGRDEEPERKKDDDQKRKRNR
jgi:hypothetical protein